MVWYSERLIRGRVHVISTDVGESVESIVCQEWQIIGKKINSQPSSESSSVCIQVRACIMKDMK